MSFKGKANACRKCGSMLDMSVGDDGVYAVCQNKECKFVEGFETVPKSAPAGPEHRPIAYTLNMLELVLNRQTMLLDHVSDLEERVCHLERRKRKPGWWGTIFGEK